MILIFKLKINITKLNITNNIFPKIFWFHLNVLLYKSAVQVEHNAHINENKTSLLRTFLFSVFEMHCK